ncbi:PREDICTED: zinc finger and BTB domain-containing protein 14-like isoform X2 [Wasmannia auropunctata]|nr:PREDICTED: zinc finger and BTB domain-containing protein 14-like isoform X2 [Wasmannia auropunctata]XP_011700575.1 PREDICTED: zinc finger and BTB domain-containing protein 14-like isoform X2 [Wasmannia auropunctata]XP_011700583.1 PREDICTED: zinc finger and BTB domain-containing protein 14-like isoform X2 [Wasmannia auropunctata]XP_011700594.1 PREDICTED: zinc finger and BTB domain-containing protein 14-like isoform X2 [Wasmannia auropunctata]XP_011700603.1 PREDICTED: zinc finger and BTB domai
MGEKTFNLTWNNHLANLSGLFEALYKSGSLTDATLACQGGMLRAHRLVLAACSPYFERVFKEHYGEQPILILKGVAVEEMECLLDFMYRGSIDVAEEHLPSLIKTATDLEIRGLSGEQKNQESNRNLYTRVETRMQRCHIETRVHTTEYIKEPSVIPFLPKHSSVDSMEDHIKVEDIEVEDDPMVIDGHEDSFDELPRSTETQIKRIPPPMYKRETRFKGQKRVSVGRVTRNNDPLESRSKDSSRESSCEDASRIIKCEPNLNDGSGDIAISGIQETSKGNSDESPKIGIRKKFEIMKRTGGNEGRETRTLSKSERAQHKPFSCDLCTLAFTRASHLARHRRVHTGERPFACSICPRMFARQDKLKQHLDSHLQWPSKRKSGQTISSLPTKGKRGRPRKVNLEQSAMEEILKFGEFSSLLNKSHSANSTNKSENSGNTGDDGKRKEARRDGDDLSQREKDNRGCQVENGQDIV